MSSPPASSFADEPRTPTSKRLDGGVPPYKAQDREIDPQFLENHLTSTPKYVWEGLLGDRWIEEINKAKEDFAPIYSPLSHLLTEISENIHQSVLLENERPVSHIKFLDNDHHRPAHHPYDANDKPDILAVPGPFTNYQQVDGGPVYRGVPHHKVVSLVECKPQREDGRVRAVNYSFRLLEVRPDMPGVYVLRAQSEGYEILWSDASGFVASGFSAWDNLALLAGYVYSLYRPPAFHFLHDPTITPPTSELKPSNGILWTVQAHLPEPYTSCESIFVGSPPGRRTNVWRHGSQYQKTLVVIKDSYVDKGRLYKENELLKHIHQNGVYPGVVRLLGDVHFTAPITTAQLATKSHTRLPERTRTRLVLGSYGVPLRQAKSIKDILMAMYDIVEVHRGLLKDARVLHRDISSHNILMYPYHHPETHRTLVENPPLFIDQVLDKDKTGDGTDMARALLIDFDNGAFIPASSPQPNPSPIDASDSEISEELASRTGTPLFIARSVSRSSLLYKERMFHGAQMPELTPPAKKLYIDAYTERTYDSYSDREGHIHGRAIPITNNKTIPAQEKFYHRPDHDIESIFWVLLVTLMRAQPQSRSNNDNLGLKDYWDAYDCLLNHTIEAAKKVDTRVPLLRYSVSDFEAILDPRLASLAPMLEEMAVQISPEYGFLDPPPAQEHLHEAMRRLLLEEIVRMNNENDSILLEAGTSRPLRPEESGSPESTSTYSRLQQIRRIENRPKRVLDDSDEGSRSPKSKKLRGTYGDDGLRPRYIE